MKCTHCSRDADVFTIFEARMDERILRAPGGHCCRQHGAFARALFEQGKLVGYTSGANVQQFVDVYQGFGRRNPELWRELEGKEGPQLTIAFGISNFTPAQADELQAAWKRGATVAEPREVNVDVLTAEEAAREIGLRGAN